MKNSVKSALEEIEANKPTGEAKIRVDIYGGGMDEGFIRGTRAGLVTAGLRLIRAGLGEANGRSPNYGIQAEENFDDILHSDSDVGIDWIEVSQELGGEPRIRQQTRKALKKEGRRIGLLGILLAMAIIVFLALIIKK